MRNGDDLCEIAGELAPSIHQRQRQRQYPELPLQVWLPIEPTTPPMTLALRLVERRNAERSHTVVPTIHCAVAAGTPWLDIHCPRLPDKQGRSKAA